MAGMKKRMTTQNRQKSNAKKKNPQKTNFLSEACLISIFLNLLDNKLYKMSTHVRCYIRNTVRTGPFCLDEIYVNALLKQY